MTVCSIHVFKNFHLPFSSKKEKQRIPIFIGYFCMFKWIWPMVWPRDSSVWSTVWSWSGKKSDLALSGLATIFGEQSVKSGKKWLKNDWFGQGWQILVDLVNKHTWANRLEGENIIAPSICVTNTCLGLLFSSWAIVIKAAILIALFLTVIFFSFSKCIWPISAKLLFRLGSTWSKTSSHAKVTGLLFVIVTVMLKSYTTLMINCFQLQTTQRKVTTDQSVQDHNGFWLDYRAFKTLSAFELRWKPLVIRPHQTEVISDRWNSWSLLRRCI